jgi:hypothetical protein
MTKDKIVSDLKVLSRLRSGQTLSTSSMSIMEHNTWGTWMYRRFSRESKTETVNFVVNLLTTALEFAENNKDYEIINLIKDSLSGFMSLQDTYKDDQVIVEKIANIVDDISTKVVKFNLERLGILKNNEQEDEKNEEEISPKPEQTVNPETNIEATSSKDVEEPTEIAIPEPTSSKDTEEPTEISTSDPTPNNEQETEKVITDISQIPSRSASISENLDETLSESTSSDEPQSVPNMEKLPLVEVAKKFRDWTLRINGRA